MRLNQLIAALERAREHSLDDIDGDSEVRVCLDAGAPETARIQDIETEDGTVRLMIDIEG